MFYVITSTFFLFYSYVFSLKKYRSKYSVYIIIILASILFAINRHNNDYNEYLLIFANPHMHAEPGYAAFVDLLKSFGFQHHNYVLLALGVFFGITFFRYAKYTPYAAFVVSLYFIFPMSSDITQVRNTFSLFFFLNSLLFYIQDKKVVTYILLMIGVSFHIMGILYLLVFLLLELKIHKKSKKLFIILISFATVIFTFSIPYLIKIASTMSNIRTFSYYISEEEKLFSFFTWGAPLLCDVFIFYFLINITKNKVLPDKKAIIDCIYAIIVLSVAFLPSAIYLFEINRYFRSIFILKYILAALLLPYLNGRMKTVVLAYIVLSASIFGFYYHSQLDNDYVFYGI